MKLTLSTASSPRWVDSQQQRVELVVRFLEIDEDLPFTADPNDVEEHGRDIFARAVAGEFGAIAPYAAPPSTADTQ